MPWAPWERSESKPLPSKSQRGRAQQTRKPRRKTRNHRTR